MLNMKHYESFENASISELKILAKKFDQFNGDLIDEGYFDDDKQGLIKLITMSPKYMNMFSGKEFMKLMEFNSKFKRK